jgi:hypothetical protein
MIVRQATRTVHVIGYELVLGCMRVRDGMFRCVDRSTSIRWRLIPRPHESDPIFDATTNVHERGTSFSGLHASSEYRMLHPDDSPRDRHSILVEECGMGAEPEVKKPRIWLVQGISLADKI